jgi:hypothetical protein
VIVRQPAAVCKHEVDPFGGVHTGTAAEPDEQIDASFASDYDAAIDVLGCGIRLNLVENDDVETCCPERFDAVLGMTGSADSRVGADEHPLSAELFRKRTEPREPTRTENDASSRIEVKVRTGGEPVGV